MKKQSFFNQAALLLCSLLLSYSSLAQSGYETELRNSINVPNSPEAEAFQQYGDPSVSLYTGKPNIAIPLHVYRGREMNLPISLTYNSTAIRVDQEATQTGLGWNLAIGGRISRIVNGSPDDFLRAAPAYNTWMDNLPTSNEKVSDKILEYIENNTTFSSRANAEQYLTFLHQVNRGEIDTQLDFFSLNLHGLNDMIVFDLESGKPRTLNNPRIKVSAYFDTNNSLQAWSVIGEDGTTYEFNLAEETETHDSDFNGDHLNRDQRFGLLKNYNSSWVLTNIFSPNSKDHYSLQYTPLGFWQQEGPMETAVSETNAVDGNGSDDTYPVGSGSQIRTRRSYFINPQALKTVFHNGVKIFGFNLKPRKDHGQDSALDNIEIFQPRDGTVTKTIRFDHSYFGLGPSYLDVRLKLDGITFLDSKKNEYGNNYAFTYDHPRFVPSRSSLGRDYMGYNNGKSYNKVLYPNGKLGNDTYEGADRRANFSSAKFGILTHIKYPTKGSTEFIYESHGDMVEFVPTTVVDLLAGQRLNGGISPFNETDCGGPCRDDFFFGKSPKTSHKSFTVRTREEYTLDVINTIQSPTITPSEGSTETEIGLISPSRNKGLVYLVKKTGNDNLSFEDILFGGANIIYSRSTATAHSITKVVLEPGDYQIALANSSPNGQSYLGVSIKRMVSKPQVVGQYAGLRISKTIDFTKDGKFAKATEYHYIKDLETGTSSRKVIFNPTLTYLTNRTAPDGSTTQLMTRVNASYGGNQPHIAYERVFAVKTDSPIREKNIDRKPLGYTSYDFKAGKSGLHSTGAPPNISSYFTLDHNVGLENNMKTHDREGNLVQDRTTEYEGRVFFNQSSLYTTHNEELNFHYSKIVKHGDVFRIDKVPAQKWCYRPHAVNLDFYLHCTANGSGIQPKSCNDPGSSCFGSIEMASLDMRLMAVTGEQISPLLIRSETFGTEDKRSSLKKSISYDYSGPRLSLGSESTLHSDGFIRKNYSYLIDKNRGVKEANRWTLVDKVTTTHIDGEGKEHHLYTTELGYENFKHFQPTSHSEKIGSGETSQREEYLYDQNGNLVEVSSKDGLRQTVSYIWSYYHKRIIAELKNVSHQQLIDLYGLEGLGYISNSELSDEGIRDLLGNIYKYFPNAQITLFTHDLAWGVTSITDPNQVTTYYNYDDAGRKTLTTDHEGYILEQNEYHYRSN